MNLLHSRRTTQYSPTEDHQRQGLINDVLVDNVNVRDVYPQLGRAKVQDQVLHCQNNPQGLQKRREDRQEEEASSAKA